MKVLSIGNSFSEDASRYLHGVAKADGTNMKVVNLYIGGCPLSVHYTNMLENSKSYALQFNGEPTGFCVSIKEAILSEAWGGWDVITLQQVSKLAPNYDTYQPYLNSLADYIHKYAPKAKLFMHQTWSYEKDSARLCDELGYKKTEEMLADLESAYAAAAADINAAGIIPCGEVFGELSKEGMKVHRDTYHANLGLGRYALALTWYKKLTGKDIIGNSFCDFDETVDPETALKVQKIVDGTLNK